MPKKIITDRDEAREKGLLNDGRYFIRTSDGTAMYLPIWYGNRLDLDNLLLFTGKENEENPQYPDINELIKEGKVRDATIYRYHDIFLPRFPGCYEGPAFTSKVIRSVVEEFRANGFKVTREAVVHNYKAWFCDLKSGWRDEENGYHLFTPCGCNPLSFRATSLEKELDWQTTYEW